MSAGFVVSHVGQALERDKLFALTWPEFRATILDSVEAGQRVSALFADSATEAGANGVQLYCVLADSARGVLRVGRTVLEHDRFPSLTPACPQVHLFEREIAEQYGVCPEGHPWLKPVRFHASYRPGHDAWGRKPDKPPVIGVTDFYRVEGEEIHEVAVGPVHAGR